MAFIGVHSRLNNFPLFGCGCAALFFVAKSAVAGTSKGVHRTPNCAPCPSTRVPGSSAGVPGTPKCDPGTPKCDPGTPKCDLGTPSCDPSTPSCDPETPKCDPGTPKCDPEMPKCDPGTPGRERMPALSPSKGRGVALRTAPSLPACTWPKKLIRIIPAVYV